MTVKPHYEVDLRLSELRLGCFNATQGINKIKREAVPGRHNDLFTESLVPLNYEERIAQAEKLYAWAIQRKIDPAI